MSPGDSAAASLHDRVMFSYQDSNVRRQADRAGKTDQPEEINKRNEISRVGSAARTCVHICAVPSFCASVLRILFCLCLCWCPKSRKQGFQVHWVKSSCRAWLSVETWTHHVYHLTLSTSPVVECKYIHSSIVLFFSCTFYFYSTNSHREIMYFLFHYNYLTALLIFKAF